MTGVTVNSAQVIAVGAQPHDDHDLDNFNFVTISRRVRATKAKWRIFPKDTEEKMLLLMADGVVIRRKMDANSAGTGTAGG